MRDYEVLAIDPATEEAVWVSIGSPEAAKWQATVGENGEHARFVDREPPEPFDWEQKPLLMWTGMEPLEQSRSKHGQHSDFLEQAARQRRWTLQDTKTGRCSRAYTLDEVLERLAKRSVATLRRKAVYDSVTKRTVPGLHAARYPEELRRLLEPGVMA